MPQLLIVMQGPPGSGKTTLARELAVLHNALIYSTDDYMINFKGEYQFQPKMLPLFHQWNESRVKSALEQGCNVIVDNQNIKRWQVKPYVKAGIEVGATIRFVRCEGEFQNTHGVPQERVEQNRKNMEELTIEGCLSS